MLKTDFSALRGFLAEARRKGYASAQGMLLEGTIGVSHVLRMGMRPWEHCHRRRPFRAMGQGSTENHSRTAKRPVLIPPRRAHLRCPPLPLQRAGWKVTRIPGACASTFLPGAGIIAPGRVPDLRRGRNSRCRPSSVLRLPASHSSRPFLSPFPCHPAPSHFRAGFRLSGRGLLARVPSLRFRLLLEARRIGSFLFEHWWGIIKITIQVSGLEGGKREKCFIGNGFMILFSSFPAARAP